MHTDYLNTLIELIGKSEISRGKTQIDDWNGAFEGVVSRFLAIREARRKVFFIGNGGSAAIASHMTADFLKNGGMCTVSLYDSALLTCLGNDCGYERIFSASLERLMEKEDLLVAISSSGNSPNIVEAIQTARMVGGSILTLSGFRADNRIRSMGDWNIYVPAEHYGMVESIHTIFLQQIVDELLARRGQ